MGTPQGSASSYPEEAASQPLSLAGRRGVGLGGFLLVDPWPGPAARVSRVYPGEPTPQSPGSGWLASFGIATGWWPGAPVPPEGVPTIGGRAFQGWVNHPLPPSWPRPPKCRRAAPSRELGGFGGVSAGLGAVGPGSLAGGVLPPPWFEFPPVMTCVRYPGPG